MAIVCWQIKASRKVKWFTKEKCPRFHYQFRLIGILLRGKSIFWQTRTQSSWLIQAIDMPTLSMALWTTPVIRVVCPSTWMRERTSLISTFSEILKKERKSAATTLNTTTSAMDTSLNAGAVLPNATKSSVDSRAWIWLSRFSCCP